MVSRRNGSIPNSTRDCRLLRRKVEKSGRSPAVPLNFQSMRSGVGKRPRIPARDLRKLHNDTPSEKCLASFQQVMQIMLKSVTSRLELRAAVTISVM